MGTSEKHDSEEETQETTQTMPVIMISALRFCFLINMWNVSLNPKMGQEEQNQPAVNLLNSGTYLDCAPCCWIYSWSWMSFCTLHPPTNPSVDHSVNVFLSEPSDIRHMVESHLNLSVKGFFFWGGEQFFIPNYSSWVFSTLNNAI